MNEKVVVVGAGDIGGITGALLFEKGSICLNGRRLYWSLKILNKV